MGKASLVIAGICIATSTGGCRSKCENLCEAAQETDCCQHLACPHVDDCADFCDAAYEVAENAEGACDIDESIEICAQNRWVTINHIGCQMHVCTEGADESDEYCMVFSFFDLACCQAAD